MEVCQAAHASMLALTMGGGMHGSNQIGYWIGFSGIEVLD